MDPTTPGPWARPIGAPTEEYEPVPPEDAAIPWIDVHQHTQSLTWNDREAFGLSGARATVMIAASYYWSPYRPVSAEDVRFLWDDALRRADAFARTHPYEQCVAVGVHTWSRVEGWESLVEALPAYCELDRVVAIGETGIAATQHTSPWPLADQRDLLRAEFRVADRTGLPVLLHTPGLSKGSMSALDAARYEEANASFADPVLAPETAKEDAIEIDLTVAEEVGLDEEQLVVDHAVPEVAPTVLETTDAWLAFSVRSIDATDIAPVVEEYGPDRILIDTDLAGASDADPFKMKRTVLDLLRLGVPSEDVRRVVYENPCELLGLEP
ncbi:MAG: TatD family hydrolase [Haloarculaceae archaeon]